MRIPLAVNLESRDGGVSKDAKVLNGLIESRGQDVPPLLLKRPGVSDVGLVGRGTAQLLYAWNGLQTIIGDALNGGTTTTIVSGLSFSTWNPSDKDSNATLSNGNLTVTTTSGASSGVRATLGKSAGKWYWEITKGTSSSGTTTFFGIATSSANLATPLGTDAFGYAYISDARSYHNATATSYGATLAAGDVIGFALDLDGGTLTFYKNGVSQGVAFTGISGTFFPAASADSAASVRTWTANFGAAAFSYSMPAGFSAIGSADGLAPTNGGLQFSAVETNNDAATPYLMFKNRGQAWVVDRSGTITDVTFADDMGAATYAVTSITRSGTTATATLADDVFNVGDSVTIAGADQTAYNATFTVTGVTPGAPGAQIPLTITRSGTTATATTVGGVPHGLTDGGAYTISGASDAAYNLTATITVTDSSTFTYTVTTQDSPVSPATGSPSFSNSAWEVSGTNVNNSGPSGKTVFRCTQGNNLSNGDSINVLTSGGASIVGGPYTVQNRTSSGFEFVVPGYNGAVYGGFGLSYSHGATPAITSITRSGTTMTITTAVAHGLTTAVSETFSITGCDDSAYNKTRTFATSYPTSTTIATPVTVTTDGLPVSPAAGSPIVTADASNSSFTFTVSGSPTTPATGTITATGLGGTVPGIPYIDGYFSVMDINGVIWSSDQDGPTTWPALSFITARNESGSGKALAKSLNYLVAFKGFSTEFYFDAQNDSGSPFSPVDNGFIRVGCASGDSVAKVGNSICWISQLKEGGRSVYRLDGLQPAEIASADIQRIIAADSLDTVYSYGLDLKGHPLYVLTLVGSNVTLVYDLASGMWTQWSSLTLNSTSKSVSSITLSGTTATVTTSAAHGFSDGDPVKISGADQAAYNGIFQIRVLTTTTFAFETVAGTVTPATGTITAKGYTESYFKFTKATTLAGAIYLLHETDGHLYQMQPTLYQDAGIPINVFTRSVRLDGGDDSRKKMAKLRFIGDLSDDIAMVRFSDDDSQTFSDYRNLNLNEQPCEIRKCGAFRRRSIEFRHTGNTALRAEGLELEIGR